jgi:HEAT repeat protein
MYATPSARTVNAPFAARALARRSCALLALVFLCSVIYSNVSAQASSQQESYASSSLNPIQKEIERQRQRLGSSDTEERRDAVMRLGSMSRPDSSRVAAGALRDSAPIVRATAARAVLSLPAGEAVGLLLPSLQDRDQFVRQETAYALGETRSSVAVSALVTVLAGDKEPGVRGAAAVALGTIRDELAVVPLTEALILRVPASGLLNRVLRKKMEQNEFVRRSAARALGQIGSRAAVPMLSRTLIDDRAGDDVRREAARALGQIGDPSSIAVLRAVLTSRDPYLSRIAYEALRKIVPNEAPRPY